MAKTATPAVAAVSVFPSGASRKTKKWKPSSSHES
jgi:hypothetical protein